MANALEAVQRALDEEAHARALELALEAWKPTRAPEIAEVAQLAAQKALATFDAPGGRKNEEFQRAWLEAAKRPAPLVTAWLATTLGRRLIVEADHYGILDAGYARKKYASLFERLDALKAHLPNPLVAAGLAALLTEAPFSAWDVRSGHLIYHPLVELLVLAGDLRQVEVLRGLLEHPRAPRATTREVLASLLPVAIAALGQTRVTLDDGERAAWRALLPGAAARGGADGESLFEAVVEALDDDARRLVYADWLSERADPRGELIAIQVREAKGQSSEKESKRARTLLKQHKEEWLGDLSRVFAHFELSRGFLDRATLAQNAAATEEAWERAPNDPRLRTLRFLEKGRGNTAHLAAFVLSEQTVNLRSAPVPSNAVLEKLASGPERRLEELVLMRLPAEKQLRLLAASSALPRLARLCFELGGDEVEKAIDLLVGSGVTKRVRRVRVTPDYDLGLPAMRSLKRGLFDAGLVDDLEIGHYSYDVRLKRADGGFDAEVEDRWGTFAELLTLAAGARSARVRYVDRGLKGGWRDAFERARAEGIALDVAELLPS